jgi:hypothetical protein
MSTKPRDDLVVIACHKPDLARQLEAVKFVLRRKSPANEGTAEERERTDAQKSKAPRGL